MNCCRYKFVKQNGKLDDKGTDCKSAPAGGLGSSGHEIISLLIREFLLLVFIAGLIALPVTWYLMWDWLTGFAYMVRMNPLWFAFGLMIALAIAMFTVLSQAMKAVYANPVQAIQYE